MNSCVAKTLNFLKIPPALIAIHYAGFLLPDSHTQVAKATRSRASFFMRFHVVITSDYIDEVSKCAFKGTAGKTDLLGTTGTTFGLALVVLEVLSTQFGT